ncbi:MAG: zipA [Gammaproteobacteria bacterium]|jgi:cell division protein ZipA|nr:zipA [Gammaproteobacteria bacterium]
MFDHLAKQYQDLLPILGLVAVLFILTLGLLSALGRKKSLVKQFIAEAPQAAVNSVSEEVSSELPGSIVISKINSAAKSKEISYEVEDISLEPSEQELAIAEAIAEAGEAALAASNGEPHQAQISFSEEGISSWRQAVKESLQRRLPRSPNMGAIVLYVMAPRSTQYQGQTLVNTLKAQGLTLTDKRVFQLKENDELKFFVASAVNPGTFDLESIHSFSTPGLSFILDLSAVSKPNQVFAKMLEMVSNVAEELGGDVLDQNRQRLTQAGINEYKLHIKTIENLRKANNDFA